MNIVDSVAQNLYSTIQLLDGTTIRSILSDNEEEIIRINNFSNKDIYKKAKKIILMLNINFF